MTLPAGLNIPDKKGWCLRLHKPLYGLKQAGRQWKKKLDETMAHLHFIKSNADECLYILREKGQVILLILVYVDDAAVASKELKRIEEFKQRLREFFPIKDLGELCHILGIQVTCDRRAHTIMLNQTGYIHNVLARFGMSECKPASTPLAVRA
jgi:phosphoribosyl-AMP cyclohydrolase